MHRECLELKLGNRASNTSMPFRGVARGEEVINTVLVKSLNPVRYCARGGGAWQAAVHSWVIISVVICACVTCYCKN